MSSNSKGSSAADGTARPLTSTMDRHNEPVFHLPVGGEEHPKLQGIENTTLRYQHAFYELAPYFRGTMPAKKFIENVLPSEGLEYTAKATSASISNEAQFVSVTCIHWHVYL
jgi:hypothetical protein